jgi:MoxR-like ATPase
MQGHDDETTSQGDRPVINATLAAPAWKSYRIGTIVKLDDGRSFQIDSVSIVNTDGGYKSRRFALSGPGGAKVVKSSRGITLWVAGLENDRGEPTPAVTPKAKPPVSPIAKPGVIYHANFEAILRIARLRLCVWLHGDAGGGKSIAARLVSEALGLPYYEKAVGEQTTEASLLGFIHATGGLVRTQLREAYEHGGVYLLDESDTGSPAVLAVINNLLANDFGSFPDGVVKKHENFILIAGANTVGRGSDGVYIKARVIDPSTLDRFCFVQWDYDPAIEAFSAGVPVEVFAKAKQPKVVKFLDDEGADERAIELCRKVVDIRNAVASFGKALRVKVSPRATKHGTALVRAGFSIEDALESVLWKGLDADTKAKIEYAC